jgi:hypothetical protein
MAAVSDTKHDWWFLSLARSSYCAITLLIRTDLHDDLGLSLGCMVWGFYSCWCLLACLLLTKSSYEDFTEHFSVSLRRKISPNLLSVLLSRRFWCWGFHCCSFLVYARILNACKVSLYAIQVLVIPWACTGCDELLWWCWWCSWLKLDHWLLVLFLSVACPAPPCAWPPTWLALHLLGAWLAPCCSWSWLSNHFALALAIGLIWWGEASPDAQLMSRENLCYGAVAMVLWVLQCCGAVSAVNAVSAGRLGFLGRPVLHLQNPFILLLWLLLAWHLWPCTWWPAACLLAVLAGQIGSNRSFGSESCW